MKKPFKKTGLGKFLTNPLVKETIKMIPFAGPIAGGVLEEVKGNGEGEIVSPSGSAQWDVVLRQVISAVFVGGLIYLLVKGHITMDEFKQLNKVVP